jgi:hypothetical protein
MIRSTRAQKAERLKAARRLLAEKPDMAEAAMALSRRFGLSRRQAYRYLALVTRKCTCAVAGREVSYHHTQVAGEPGAPSAKPCAPARHHDKRTGQAGRCGVAGAEVPAWVSGGRHSVHSVSNTNSIGCSPSSSRWLTTFSFPIGSGSSAPQR